MQDSLFGLGDSLGDEGNDPWANYPSRQQQKSGRSPLAFGSQPLGSEAMNRASLWSTSPSHLSASFGNLEIVDDPLKSGTMDDDHDGIRTADRRGSDVDAYEDDDVDYEGDGDEIGGQSGDSSGKAFGDLEIWSEELTQSFNPLNYHNSDEKMIIKVKEIPEKEGLVFKHINYLVAHNIRFPGEFQQEDVKSSNGETKIVRRYSDFAWLVEILWKKYPFRLIPELPPKKFSTTSNNDTIFLQKRRRGLQRFLYEIMKHPILSKETLIIMFLTVPNDFSNWKRFANVDLIDEFDEMKINLPRRFKLSIEKVFQDTPKDFDDEIDNEDSETNAIASSGPNKLSTNTIVNNITQIWSESPINYRELNFIDKITELDNSLNSFAESWNKLCVLVERIEKREYALSLENQRFAYFFEDFVNNNHHVYGMENLLTSKSVQHLSGTVDIDESQNLGIINTISKTVINFFRGSKQLKDEELNNMNSLTLENFKKLQDYGSSLHFLLERLNLFKSQSEKSIHLLLSRITKANERLIQIKIKSDIRGSEIDKLTTILTNSSTELNSTLAKIILVKQCFINEYKLFQKTKYIVSETLQDWFVEKVKYGDLQQDLLSKCFNELQDMPLK